MTPVERALASLEGLSVGDSFGQCFFQMKDPESRIRQRAAPEAPWYFTDDTEMTLSIVANLVQFGRIDQASLARSLAEHYSYDRAYGPSMHRVLDRIRNDERWEDVAASTFEGQGSYGNGAAMRAAPIGAYFADDLQAVTSQARLSAEVTHKHAEGIVGAEAVAIAAATAARLRREDGHVVHKDFLSLVIDRLPSSEVRSKLERAMAISDPASLQFAVSTLGNGTEMSAQDTVPFALWCCAHALNDYSFALWLAVSGGGDRDTLGAIVGGVVACRVGVEGIPSSWLGSRETLPAWYLSPVGS